MLVVGDALKPDKPRRAGTEFAFRARQGGKRLGLGGGTSDLGLLFHAVIVLTNRPFWQAQNQIFCLKSMAYIASTAGSSGNAPTMEQNLFGEIE